MSNLTRYGQTALDKTFPDADESVFGHMVLELGMSPNEATQNLRPWVRDLDRSAELSKKTAYVAAFIGAGAGLATAATMGIGLTAILPIAAAAYNFFAGQQSAREQGVRESEYLLLKTCPELLKLIYALTQKGMPKEALVECYDDLLGAFTMQFQQRASLGMSDELDHDIVKSFQQIVQEKCEAESLARAIVAETENFTFDTLYQSTEPKTESLPAAPVATSSPIGTATKFGAVEVSASEKESDHSDDSVATPQRIIHGTSINEPTDIAESLAVNLQSTLIVGQPGSGKGVCIAMATRAVKKLHPDVTIWAIDPKADPSEAWYWEAVDHYLPVRIDPFADAESITGIMEAIVNFIQQFQESDGAKLLIFDEALAVKEKTGRWFKGLMAGFNALCSMGRSRRQYGWLVSQSPNTDDFGISGGVRNVYRRILLISADNLGLLDNGSTYFSGKPSSENLKQTGRAFFDSIVNGWEAVPVYQMPQAPITPVTNPQREPVPKGDSHRETLEALLKLEASQDEAKPNLSKPNLSPKDLMFAIALLAEWMEENPEVEAEKIYEKYNARRKGFSRPEIRFLLTQLANLNGS